MRLLVIIMILNSFCCQISNGQNLGEFSGSKFPIHAIDKDIIEFRSLQEKIELLKTCNWSEKIGKKIDVFWLASQNGNYFAHVYEYIMDCDNLRLIYWYSNPQGYGKIIDFMIEDLEEESIYVIAKHKHLKNKKRFNKYLDTSSVK